MGNVLAIVLALIFAAPAQVEARCDRRPYKIAQCLPPEPAAGTPTVENRWQVAEDVLCCCKTYSGGECCAQVAACTGKIPGCFCATRAAPGALPVPPPSPRPQIRPASTPQAPSS
jgi:hypothetical protein